MNQQKWKHVLLPHSPSVTTQVATSSVTTQEGLEVVVFQKQM